MKDIFTKPVADEVVARINSLETTSEPSWGKMSVDQMLAHCNVAFEAEYDNKHPKPKGFKKWLVKALIKKMVVSEKPYKKNGQTAPYFLIKERKDFQVEKDRLIAYVLKTQNLGGDHFDTKESHSFGPLTKKEWNVLFYKHIDHHLTQFNV